MTLPAELNDVNSAVARKFASYDVATREKLLWFRRLILATAATLPETGGVVETLKWGQLSYLPRKRSSGTTVRIDEGDQDGRMLAMFVPCSTSLIEEIRLKHGDIFDYENNRGIRFDSNSPPDADALSDCIAMALTYHLRRKAR